MALASGEAKSDMTEVDTGTNPASGRHCTVCSTGDPSRESGDGYDERTSSTFSDDVCDGAAVINVVEALPLRILIFVSLRAGRLWYDALLVAICCSDFDKSPGNLDLSRA